MNQEANNDKRRYIRYEVLDCARVNVDGQDPFQSVVVDIGLGGLQLRAKALAIQGATCMVTVGRLDDQPIDLPCEIRHCFPLGDGGLHSIGVRFSPRTHDERITIAEFVHSIFVRQCEMLSN